MKLADIEKKVDALEGADAEIENEIAALNDTCELIRRGEEFQNSGRIRLALKCFLRAGKLYHVDGFISAAKIFVDVLSDGYAALYLYRYAIRGLSKSVAVTVTPEEQLLRKLFGEEELSVKWRYPYTFYLEALRGQAEIFFVSALAAFSSTGAKPSNITSKSSKLFSARSTFIRLPTPKNLNEFAPTVNAVINTPYVRLPTLRTCMATVRRAFVPTLTSPKTFTNWHFTWITSI